jgi:serine/threonine protein kinase
MKLFLDETPSFNFRDKIDLPFFMLKNQVPPPSENLIQLLYEKGYIYDKPVSKGGFANVYLIKSQQYDDYFILKENVAGEKTVTQYNDAELEILQKLIHPNVIKIYAFFYSELNQCLILEYCPNGSLQQFLKKKGPVKPPLLFVWAKKILQAIEYIHQQGVAHRDIKPANILIDKYEIPKLADLSFWLNTV